MMDSQYNRVRRKAVGVSPQKKGGDTYADFFDVSFSEHHRFDQNLQSKKEQPPLGQVTVVQVNP